MRYRTYSDMLTRKVENKCFLIRGTLNCDVTIRIYTVNQGKDIMYSSGGSIIRMITISGYRLERKQLDTG